MTWFRPQLHDRTIDEIIEPIMSEERLSFGDLNFVRTAFPNAFIVRCNSVFKCCRACLYRFQGFDKAMRGVKSVIGALPAI
jgi:hypothetical protein